MAPADLTECRLRGRETLRPRERPLQDGDGSSDAGLGLTAGETMLMNCNPIAFAALAGGGVAGQLMVESLLQPKAMLLSWGPDIGLQANAGVSESIGYLS